MILEQIYFLILTFPYYYMLDCTYSTFNILHFNTADIRYLGNSSMIYYSVICEL